MPVSMQNKAVFFWLISQCSDFEKGFYELTSGKFQIAVFNSVNIDSNSQLKKCGFEDKL